MAYTHPGRTRRCLRSGRVFPRRPEDDQRPAPLAMAAPGMLSRRARIFLAGSDGGYTAARL